MPPHLHRDRLCYKSGYIDSRSGHFLSYDSMYQNYHIRLPFFECLELKSCESCEMVGFYHDCKWTYKVPKL